MDLNRRSRVRRVAWSIAQHLTTVALGTIAVATVPITAAAQGTRPSPARVAAAVDSMAHRIVNAQLTPAFGVAVVMDGRVILAKSYGVADVTRGTPVDDRTLWYLASTSKSFTGFAVALLEHNRVLRFDNAISALLPKATWHSQVNPDSLTLAQFLAHTHGLNDIAIVHSAAYTGEVAESQWPTLLAAAAPVGTHDLVYSNLGYNVAAMVIDAFRPEGWRRYLERVVYEPAGLRDTYTSVSNVDRRRIAMPHVFRADGTFATAAFEKTDATMNSAGGHLSTLHDLARWTILQLDRGRIDGRQLFPAAAVERSHQMLAAHTVAASKRFAYFDREGWSAGWDIGRYAGEPMVSRFGSYHSIRSHLSFLPARRIGVVAQANGQPGWTATDLVAAFAYDLEAGRSDARLVANARLDSLVARRRAGQRQVAAQDSIRASRQRVMARPWREFAGQYRNQVMGTVRLVERDGGLHYVWGAVSGPVELYDAARSQLRIEIAGSGAIIEVQFETTGPASRILLREAQFERVP